MSIAFEAVWLRLNPSINALRYLPNAAHEYAASGMRVFSVHEQPVDVLRRLSQREFCAKMNLIIVARRFLSRRTRLVFVAGVFEYSQKNRLTPVSVGQSLLPKT